MKNFVKRLITNYFISKSCCDAMRNDLEPCYDTHSNRFDDVDKFIYKSKDGTKYGLMIHDGGNSYVKISYCPWCGRWLG